MIYFWLAGTQQLSPFSSIGPWLNHLTWRFGYSLCSEQRGCSPSRACNGNTQLWVYLQKGTSVISWLTAVKYAITCHPGKAIGQLSHSTVNDKSAATWLDGGTTVSTLLKLEQLYLKASPHLGKKSRCSSFAFHGLPTVTTKRSH